MQKNDKKIPSLQTYKKLSQIKASKKGLKRASNFSSVAGICCLAADTIYHKTPMHVFSTASEVIITVPLTYQQCGLAV